MESCFYYDSGGERNLKGYDRRKKKNDSVEPSPPLLNPPPPPPPANPPRPLNIDGTFTTRVHYNGLMNKSPRKEYIGGLVEYMSNCDPDRWSKLEVDDMLEKKGLDVTWLEYYFSKSRMNMDEGLTRLFNNQSSMEMAKIGLEIGVIDLYAVNELEPTVDVEYQVHAGDEVVEGNMIVSQVTQEEVADVNKETEVEVPDIEEEIEIIVDDDQEDMTSDDEEYEKQVKVKMPSTSTMEDISGKPSFVDSDYDLTDDEEDEVMNGQVESWKKIVSEMETRKDDELVGVTVHNIVACVINQVTRGHGVQVQLLLCIIILLFQVWQLHLQVGRLLPQVCWQLRQAYEQLLQVWLLHLQGGRLFPQVCRQLHQAY